MKRDSLAFAGLSIKLRLSPVLLDSDYFGATPKRFAPR